MRRTGILLPMALLLSFLACYSSGPEASPLKVFAAASLQEVAIDLGKAFTDATGTEVSYNFAGSNTLALQILAAGGADCFLSADLTWIDHLEAAGRLQPSSRRLLWSNRQVVVARRDSQISLGQLSDLAAADYRRLILADPQAVPAGRYARDALQRTPWEGTNLWDAVAPQVVPVQDVRAVAGLVASDPEHLGIVYRTDLPADPRLRALLELPEDPAVPIAYGAALLRSTINPEPAAHFLDFLASPQGLEIAARHGFLPPKR